MKALTIWQPWASLIVAGAKPYEFRGWRPPASLIGQRIVIHGAARQPTQSELHEFRQILRWGVEEASNQCLHYEDAEPVLELTLLGRLPFGSALGTAIIGEPVNGFTVAERFGNRPKAGTWSGEANWGWPMLDIDPWAEPIPMRGKHYLADTEPFIHHRRADRTGPHGDRQHRRHRSARQLSRPHPARPIRRSAGPRHAHHGSKDGGTSDPWAVLGFTPSRI